jgi:hypothetical protein
LLVAALLWPSGASAQLPALAPTTAPQHPLGQESFWPWIVPPEGLSASAYVQGQYENHQDSQDQVSQSGQPLNKNRFSVRRARASLMGEWEYAAGVLELDTNTTNGPQVDLRKAEASLQYRPDRSRPPLLMATLGLFDVPFGYEVTEASRTRYFMEMTTAATAFFPGQADLGIRLAGALGFFRWTLAAQNGEPLGESSSFVLTDPNDAKDVVFRFGFDTSPMKDLHLAGDCSALRGRGFHAGTTATGSSLQWHDLNEDGLAEQSEITGVPGQAGSPSQSFDRWAVGADLRVHYRWWLGDLKVYGEAVLAQNMDHGLFVADPVTTGVDQRELAFYAAAVQEVTRWGLVGLRYDYYDPNSNAFDKRGGRLLPYSEAIRTLSPLVGLVVPHARLFLQYDMISNAFARSDAGVPTSLKDNVWTVRLQVEP